MNILDIESCGAGIKSTESVYAAGWPFERLVAISAHCGIQLVCMKQVFTEAENCVTKRWDKIFFCGYFL